jgi:hypothetical protein
MDWQRGLQVAVRCVLEVAVRPVPGSGRRRERLLLNRQRGLMNFDDQVR